MGQYLLLFSNPSYAQAYQDYVMHLHRLAETHTPTSLESPMAPPKGMLVEGEDVYSLMQEYALCPSSQTLSLHARSPAASSALRRLAEHGGYPQITGSPGTVDRSGRSALFQVDRLEINARMIEDFLGQDGKDRGTPWALASDGQPIERLVVPEDTEGSGLEARNALGTDLGVKVSARHGWVITFEDEDETRRFIRRWHRKPFPLKDVASEQKEAESLIYTELLW